MVVAVLSVLATSCASDARPTRTIDPNADLVVPYNVDGGGIIRFTVRPQYALGQQIVLTVDIVAGSIRIRGPLSGRVQTVGTSGETVVRTFAPTELSGTDVAPHATARVVVRWDGRDDAGVQLPPETYSLALDFLIAERAMRLGSVVQIVH